MGVTTALKPSPKPVLSSSDVAAAAWQQPEEEEEDVISVQLERDGGLIHVGSSGWADIVADTEDMRAILLECLQGTLQCL